MFQRNYGRPYSVATTSACGSEVQKPVDVPQVKYTQDLESFPLLAFLCVHSYPAWSWGEQSNVCFEALIKRDLMALVRAQEETLDFNTLQLRWQLRLTAGLRRTRIAVSSLRLATAAQGLQLDIAHRLRTAFVVVQARLPPTAFDSHVLESTEVSAAPLLIRRPVSKSHLWQCRERLHFLSAS